jgi:threonine/homoserine/homoserine lactone efflux protein
VGTSFLAGVIAGYGIAIPVGAIAVLIIETGIRRGFRRAALAGAGAATADGVYAVVAAGFGLALAGLIEPLATPLRLVSVVVLLVIAARSLRLALAERTVRRAPGAAEVAEAAGEGDASGDVSGSGARTFLSFLGLTLLNPMTVVYFAALILGLPSIGEGVGERAAFVAGAFLASLSWQWLLASVAAVLHRRLPAEVRSAVGIVGAIVVAGFAVGIATGI